MTTAELALAFAICQPSLLGPLRAHYRLTHLDVLLLGRLCEEALVRERHLEVTIRTTTLAEHLGGRASIARSLNRLEAHGLLARHVRRVGRGGYLTLRLDLDRLLRPHHRAASKPSQSETVSSSARRPEEQGFRALAADLERRLVRRAQGGDREALEALAAYGVPLVRHLARRHAQDGVLVEDLIAVGNEALLRCIAEFDPQRGARLSTVAHTYLRNAMIDHLPNASVQPVNRRALGRRRQLEQLTDELTHTLKRAPTRTELAAAANLPAAQVERLLAHSDPVTLADADTLVDPSATTETAALAAHGQTELQRILGEAVAALPEPERVVLVHRFGLAGQPALSKEETALALGLPLTRVARLYADGLAQLRTAALIDSLRGWLS